MQVQVDGELPAAGDSQLQNVESPSPAKITGLVSMEGEGSESVEVHPPSPERFAPLNAKKPRMENPFAKPASMPMEVKNAAKEQVEQHTGLGSTAVEVSITDQRALKRQLEEDEKVKAEKKKHDAENKKKEAAKVALMKAEAKLAKAQAKAKALDEKAQGVRAKRKLDGEFAKVSDDKEGPPVSPPKAPKRSRGKKTPNTKKKTAEAKVVLSPKAKAFAAAAPKGSSSSLSREAKAKAALAKLRDLNLCGLELPAETFNKMILACICAT